MNLGEHKSFLLRKMLAGFGNMSVRDQADSHYVCARRVHPPSANREAYHGPEPPAIFAILSSKPCDDGRFPEARGTNHVEWYVGAGYAARRAEESSLVATFNDSH